MRSCSQAQAVSAEFTTTDHLAPNIRYLSTQVRRTRPSCTLRPSRQAYILAPAAPAGSTCDGTCNIKFKKKKRGRPAIGHLSAVVRDFIAVGCPSVILGQRPTLSCSPPPAGTMASQPQDPANPDKKKRPSALRSILAGSTAGAIEIGMLPNPPGLHFCHQRRTNTLVLAITYPAECMS